MNEAIALDKNGCEIQVGSAVKVPGLDYRWTVYDMKNLGQFWDVHIERDLQPTQSRTMQDMIDDPSPNRYAALDGNKERVIWSNNILEVIGQGDE